MPAAALPANEEQRLDRLRKYGILDTPAEEAFDRIVRLAASILDVPMATISLVDDGRQWFKAKIGLDAPETSRDVAFCAHAILNDEVFVVDDATLNPLFSDNPLVIGEPKIRFYAGAPLTTHDGFNIGTVCGIDCKPRTVTQEQRALLRDLGAMVIDQMELRAAGRTALAEVEERVRIDAFKSAFISTVNHELRTPLTSIIGAIELITSGVAGDVTAEVLDLLNIADRNSAVLLRLINDLLDSAKIAEGNLKFDMARVDLDKVVRESVENIANYCREHQISVHYRSNGAVASEADKVRIAQVMNNLLSNAVKFSPRGAAVDVTLAVSGKEAEVSVIDRAGGIPDAIRGRIFEKFVQAHRGNAPRPGTGLGLSIAKGIIEQHNGKIGFETEPGVGSRFYFRLPVA